jgi:hypothetical protein
MKITVIPEIKGSYGLRLRLHKPLEYNENYETPNTTMFYKIQSLLRECAVFSSAYEYEFSHGVKLESIKNILESKFSFENIIWER